MDSCASDDNTTILIKFNVFQCFHHNLTQIYSISLYIKTFRANTRVCVYNNVVYRLLAADSQKAVPTLFLAFWRLGGSKIAVMIYICNIFRNEKFRPFPE